jgi:hypothetical protein
MNQNIFIFAKKIKIAHKKHYTRVILSYIYYQYETSYTVS